MPNKVRIGWHFSSNKYTYRDVYSALKNTSRVWYSGFLGLEIFTVMSNIEAGGGNVLLSCLTQDG